MKIGDTVATPRGPGKYIGGKNGRIGAEVNGFVGYWLPCDVAPYDPPSQVDAVVGEQCVAILERLRDALGVASIGEVEAAVMGMLSKAET